MEKHTTANKKWWNSATKVHKSSSLYDLKSFKKGKTSLQSTELEELGNVKGKTMLHLMCHFGMDTLSWAREGAIVTGVDLSDESIRLAQQLSAETNIPGTFICSDIYDLPKKLDKQYDIVFLSYGVLLWLSDIKKFTDVVHHFLKKGGTFYIVELHPFTNLLTYDFKLSYDYFDQGPYEDDSSGTYTDWENKMPGVTYEWSYTVSDVINTLIEKDFSIEFFHEFPYTMYNQFPGFMKKNQKGQYVLKSSSVKVPLLFSIKAQKK